MRSLFSRLHARASSAVPLPAAAEAPPAAATPIALPSTSSHASTAMDSLRNLLRSKSFSSAEMKNLGATYCSNYLKIDSDANKWHCDFLNDLNRSDFIFNGRPYPKDFAELEAFSKAGLAESEGELQSSRLKTLSCEVHQGNLADICIALFSYFSCYTDTQNKSDVVVEHSINCFSNNLDRFFISSSQKKSVSSVSSPHHGGLRNIIPVEGKAELYSYVQVDFKPNSCEIESASLVSAGVSVSPSIQRVLLPK